MELKTSVAILLMIIFVKLAFAAEPYNYAELWRSWNIAAREAYISGVVDGIGEAFLVTMITIAPDKLAKSSPHTKVEKVREKLFVRYTRDQLPDVITYLYRDPANALISTLDMFFLARDKIEGKDIGKSLMEARKKAMDTHQMNEDIRRK